MTSDPETPPELESAIDFTIALKPPAPITLESARADFERLGFRILPGGHGGIVTARLDLAPDRYLYGTAVPARGDDGGGQGVDGYFRIGVVAPLDGEISFELLADEGSTIGEAMRACEIDAADRARDAKKEIHKAIAATREARLLKRRVRECMDRARRLPELLR